jgi:hypothetical protein
MKTAKSLLFAGVITVVSIAALIIIRGVPSSHQLITNGATMFAVSFLVLKIFGGRK